jgi:hypothetical protein
MEISALRRRSQRQRPTDDADFQIESGLDGPVLRSVSSSPDGLLGAAGVSLPFIAQLLRRHSSAMFHHSSAADAWATALAMIAAASKATERTLALERTIRLENLEVLAQDLTTELARRQRSRAAAVSGAVTVVDEAEALETLGAGSDQWTAVNVQRVVDRRARADAAMMATFAADVAGAKAHAAAGAVALCLSADRIEDAVGTLMTYANPDKTLPANRGRNGPSVSAAQAVEEWVQHAYDVRGALAVPKDAPSVVTAIWRDDRFGTVENSHGWVQFDRLFADRTTFPVTTQWGGIDLAIGSTATPTTPAPGGAAIAVRPVGDAAAPSQAVAAAGADATAPITSESGAGARASLDLSLTAFAPIVRWLIMYRIAPVVSYGIRVAPRGGARGGTASDAGDAALASTVAPVIDTARPLQWLWSSSVASAFLGSATTTEDWVSLDFLVSGGGGRVRRRAVIFANEEPQRVRTAYNVAPSAAPQAPVERNCHCILELELPAHVRLTGPQLRRALWGPAADAGHAGVDSAEVLSAPDPDVVVQLGLRFGHSRVGGAELAALNPTDAAIADAAFAFDGSDSLQAFIRETFFRQSFSI